MASFKPQNILIERREGEERGRRVEKEKKGQSNVKGEKEEGK